MDIYEFIIQNNNYYYTIYKKNKKIINKKGIIYYYYSSEELQMHADHVPHRHLRTHLIGRSFLASTEKEMVRACVCVFV